MSKKLSNALYYLSLLASAILIILLFRLIKVYDILCIIFDLTLPIFLGFSLAWLLNPIFKKLNKKIDKRVSILLIILLLIFVYSLIIMRFIPIFKGEIGNILDIIDILKGKAKEMPFIDLKETNFNLKLEDILASCGGIVNIVINFALIHIFGFYILYNYDIVIKFLKSLIPKKYTDITLKFTKKLSINMRLFIKGTLIDSSILFLLALILFTIFGFKYSLIIAFFISITNIIPFIGPYIGGIPAVLLGLSISIKKGIIALLIVIACQLIESNIVNPIIMSKVTKINPLIIIIAITFIGKFLGLLGMAFAVPILIFLKILYEFILKWKKQHKVLVKH